jgi:hypothetical protein
MVHHKALSVNSDYTKLTPISYKRFITLELTMKIYVNNADSLYQIYINVIYHSFSVRGRDRIYGSWIYNYQSNQCLLPPIKLTATI